MLRRVRIPLLVALGGFAGLGLVWLLAYHVGAAQRVDARAFRFVTGGEYPGTELLPWVFAVWMVPPVYAVLVGVVLHRAWTRRGPAVAVAAGGVVVGANVVAQVLKSATATPRPWAVTEWGSVVNAVSWPSGHATAATALAIAATLAVEPRLRRRVAILGAAFALCVGLAVVRMAWHMPSDALGGWCLALAFGGAAVCVLRVVEQRSSRAGGAARVAPAQSV